MSDKCPLCNQLVEVSQDYLGPAADRFIERQIATHVKKSPAEITLQDVKALIDWLKLSFALLTRDTKLVDEYVGRLESIAAGRPDEALGEKWQHN